METRIRLFGAVAFILVSILINILISLLQSNASFAQSTPVEVMIGNQNYQYQHIFMKRISEESKFGFFNVSMLYAFYNKKAKDEIMSQSYLTYSLRHWVTFSLGTFYASRPGFSPSFAMQFIKKKNNFFFLAVPRIDLKRSPTYDAMILAEFKPPVSKKTNLYFRLQFMSNFQSNSHNRSYQNLRAGVDVGKFQFGLAANTDEYGNEEKINHNDGVFFRVEL